MHSSLKRFCYTFCMSITTVLFLCGMVIIIFSHFSNGVNFDGSNDDKRIVSLFYIIKDPFYFMKYGKAVNILVLGGDRVNKNTDTIMLVNYNPSTAEMSILSIPRDTKVKIKGRYAKVNSAYPEGGADLSVKTVGRLLKTNINHYVFIDTSVFRETIDLLGGIKYNIPVNMDYDDPIQNLHIHLKKGMQVMDGKKSEQFMRFRHYNYNIKNKYYDGSDLKRIEAQQCFIKEILRQKANLYYLSKAGDILEVLMKNIETDLTSTDVLKMLRNANRFDSSKINAFKLPGVPLEEKLWYYIYDQEETDQIVKQYFK